MRLVEGASHSSYDAPQVRLQQRFSHGFTLLSSFSWEKSIDNGSGVQQANGDAYIPQDVYNLHRLMDAVLGGWQLGGILTLEGGFPLSVYCTSNGTYESTDSGCRADVTGQNPALSNPTPNQWFNLAAFVNRTDFTPRVGPYRFGPGGRNVVNGPGVVGLDGSLSKSFHVTEKARLDFRAEFFNLPNHPIFGQPGGTVGTSSYGVISSTNLDNRQIQFGRKMVF